ncbi:MAG: hypothetical protein Q9187_004129 [Circinaria calcarea]
MAGDDRIFIIEGAITAVVAIICYFVMADWPETAKFLIPKDREMIKARISNDGGTGRMDRLDSRAIKRCLSDWKIWSSIAIYICTVNTLYAINLFSPTIIAQLNPHFTPRAAQARVIPLFVVSAIAAAITAYASDRLRHRYSFAMAGYGFALVGWIILLCQKHAGVTVGVRYMALYFVSVGGYITLPLLWTLLANNSGGRYKVAIASAAQIGFGNSGGIIASLIFQSKEAPFYLTGYAVSCGLIVVAALGLTAFVWVLKWENRKRERGERNWRLGEADADNLGDDHPSFRFVF